MLKFGGPALVLAACMFAGGVAAQQISSQAACMAAVKDIKTSFEGRDIGEKASAEVQTLIEVSESLCGRGNFADAKTLIDLARSMLATE